jgi:hypothetical protein
MIGIITKLNMVGAAIAAVGNPLYANMIWSVTNPYLVHHHYSISKNSTDENIQVSSMHQYRMFLVFMIISWIGVLYRVYSQFM